MTYEEAKRERDALDAAVEKASAAINRFPRLPMGLTPDDVKVTPEYQAAKAVLETAFQRYRDFNGYFVKTFAKEYRADRRKQRRAK